MWTKLSALTFCVMMAAAGAKAETPHVFPQQEVFAFCRMHGTLDHPEQTFFGTSYQVGMLPKSFHGTDVSNWRCMDGETFVCRNSASGDWCSKKDPNRTPSAYIKEFCVDYPGSNFVTNALESYSASHWRCNGSKPVIDETWALDKRGFMQKMWPRLVVRDGVMIGPHPDDFGMR